MLVKLKVDKVYNDRTSLTVKTINPVSDVRRQQVKKVYLRLRSEQLGHEHPIALQRLEKICANNSGNTPLHFVLCYPKIKFTLASSARIDMNDELLFQLQSLPNLECVIGYPRE